MKKYLLLAFIAVSLVGCSNDSNESTSPTNTTADNKLKVSFDSNSIANYSVQWSDGTDKPAPNLASLVTSFKREFFNLDGTFIVSVTLQARNATNLSVILNSETIEKTLIAQKRYKITFKSLDNIYVPDAVTQIN